MRPIRDGGCILIAIGSIALAAWQPDAGATHTQTFAPSGAAQRVDGVFPRTVDRAILSAPLLKA